MFTLEDGLIEKVKYNYKNLPRIREDNVRELVICEMLKGLGYDPLTFDREHPVYHQTMRADIAIEVSNNKYLYVEAKAGDIRITEKEINQLVDYLNTRSIEWGLLSNGKEFILLNNDIKTLPLKNQSTSEDKIVMRIDIFDKRNGHIRFLPLLKMENIFENKITQYFKDVAQYKAFKFPKNTNVKTWNAYKGTLLNFFSFYAVKEGKYRSLSEIRTDDFEDFLKNSRTHKEINNEEQTYGNKWSHIRVMFQELEKHGLQFHNFRKERKNLLKASEKKDNNHKPELTLENVKKMLDLIKGRDSIRNRAFILLCVYMAPDIKMIENLKKDMVHGDILLYDNVRIPLPNKLSRALNDLIAYHNKEKIKIDKLFYSFYEKQYKKFDEQHTYNIFSSFSKKDNTLKGFSVRMIRKEIISLLFKNGYSIEEIYFLTGMELNNIGKIITQEEIFLKVDLTKQRRRKHPFEEILY